MSKSFFHTDENRPFLIAGPCSAETREQVLETARQLSVDGRTSLFRAGIWKPRTNPGNFEGVGLVGLDWLVEVKDTYQIPVCTEVANARHVEECLKKGIDVLWIGARTSVNPFSVQEIAEALKGVNIPVMVKNPINPDLKLWIGALERMKHVGIEELAAVHRGFSSQSPGIYRNKPMWELPIQLRSSWPGLPIFCDPSHIGGKRELLRKIAQRSFDLGMHGLMIETHPNPFEAWSDAEQQLSPEKLFEMLDMIKVKSLSSIDPDYLRELETLRSDIDEIDDEIIQLLAKRMQMSEKIGGFKKNHDIVVVQLARWKEILETRKQNGVDLGLSEEFMQAFLNELHQESIKKQTAIIQNGKSKKTGSDEVMW